MDRIRRLENPIRTYAWGSRRFLAALQGRPVPTPEPEAELWMGAHPSAPSRVVAGEERVPLDRWIARDPARVLGASVAQRHFGELPFLLKILAVEAPLSVQVHPDAAQAEAGFAREQAERPGIDAADRCYRDSRPKPELIHALTPFDALVGQRAAPEVLADLEALEMPALEPLTAALRERPGAAGLRTAWERLLAWRREPPAWLPELIARASERADSVPTAALVTRVAAAWPEDPAFLVPCFLNAITLSPGESLFVEPGTVHAYLGGAAVEVQANSDNVLRAGLTGKHVDPAELLRIASFEPSAPRLTTHLSGVQAPAFCMEELRVGGATELASGIVRILACVEGRLEVRDGGPEGLVLGPGTACFVPASASDCRLAGHGRIFAASPGRA